MWQKIVSRLQETIFARCDMSENVEPNDYAIVHNLNLVDSRQGGIASNRSFHVK